MNVFDLVLAGLSEISEKILHSNDLCDENANLGHFTPFLTCFWPGMTPASVSNTHIEYI